LIIQKLNQLLGHNGSIYALLDLPETPYFLSAGGDGWIVQWHKDGSQADGTLLASVDGQIFSLFLIENTQTLVAGDMNGHVYWIDLVTKKTLKRVSHHEGSVFDFIQINQNLYSIGADGYLVQWDIENMLPIISIRISSQGLRCIEKDEKYIYIGASDNAIYVLDKDSLQTIHTIQHAHQNTVFTLNILPNNILISGGRDALLKKWDLQTYEELQSISAHWYTVNKIANIDSGKFLITGSRDKTIRVWNSEDMTLLKSIDLQKGGHLRSVNDILYINDSSTFISAGDDKSIILWKIS